MDQTNPQDNNLVPSSLSSVNVRTMESDVESIKSTGGTHPIPEVVDTAPVFSNNQPIQEEVEGAPVPRPSHFGWAWWVLGFAILFMVGYFILPLFM